MDAEMADDFRRNLFKYRLLANLSYEVLAGMTEIDQRRLSYFEHGKREPTPEQYVAISRALDVPLRDMVKPCGFDPDLTKEQRRQIVCWFEEKRKARNMTKIAWATKLFLDANYYSDIVNQFKVPSSKQLNLMAYNADTTVTAILAEEEQK